MKKVYIALFVLIFSSFASVAKVSFITEKPEGDAGFGSVSSPPPHSSSTEVFNRAKCNGEGYIHTSCEEGYYLADQCHYDKKYYKTCCSNDYNSSREDCIKEGSIPSTIPCGGKYRCN